MAVLVDTTELPPRQRPDAVIDAVRNTVAPSEIAFASGPGPLRYRIEYWQLGPAMLVRAGGDPVRMRRTRAQVRDCAPEQATFGFHPAGTGYQEQNGCRTDQAQGDVSLLDMTRPFEFGMGGNCVHGSLGIGFDALALPVDMIRRSTSGLRGSPVYDLFKTHLLGLVPAAQALTDTREAGMLAAATVELARALVATSGDHNPRLNAPLHDALRTRIMVYAQQHLTDRDLTADRIAAAHSISLRHLYNLWSRDNTLTIAEWIISARLEGARRELLHADAQIAMVARRWGFVDATHFSRRFRLAYGMSPREWRHLNRERPPTALAGSTGGLTRP